MQRGPPHLTPPTIPKHHYPPTPQPGQVSICAVVGGVFTVAGILDSILYQVDNKILRKKLDLGEASCGLGTVWNGVNNGVPTPPGVLLAEAGLVYKLGCGCERHDGLPVRAGAMAALQPQPCCPCGRVPADGWWCEACGLGRGTALAKWCAFCCLHGTLCSLHDFSDAPKLSLDCRQARLSQPRTAAVSARLQQHVVTGAGAARH